MIFLKTDDEIELLRKSNLLVGKTLAEIAKVIKPGVTTKELDKVAEEFIRDNGAVPTFKGFPNQYGEPFPASICTSVNEQVVHGIPSDDVVLKEGDVVSVDCGTYMNGFCGDSAYTFCVGEVDEEVRKLLKVTKEALYIGIQNAVQGKRLGDIGYAIQQHCESNSYGVVREFVGHGIGKEMHEDPQVPNYGKRGYGTMLKKGLCIAIEPMITLGNRQIVMERDGWTVRTKDCKYAAHFEHTIAVGSGEADILSSFKFIEEVKEGDAEMIVLPGGLPGATNLDAHEGLGKLIMTFAEAGRPLSAICAAPLVYGKRGLLKGKKVTCYPGFEKYLEGAEYTAALIEKDGNFITGKGPGAAMAFSFAIAEKYVGAEKVTELKQGMMIAE